MIRKFIPLGFVLNMLCSLLSAQQGFFLNTWGPKSVVVPSYSEAPPVSPQANASVTIHATDTLTRVPVYMFGDNANSYTTSMSENKTLMGYLSDRKMGVLRGPSGSISDVYFWNRSQNTPPPDVPATLLSGGDNPGWEWYGIRPNAGDAGWTMGIDSFYRVLSHAQVTGLLTVNYGYARYGTSINPVAQAAHMAADWVRYDHGRTKFWEIGNEVFGNWEAGYRINTALNKDGQPEYINGTLYGQHCKVFIDSMKAAAAQIGVEIYIGAVTVEASGTGPANWNVDLMREVGGVIDFYILHSYYTPYNQNSNATVILNAPAQTQGYMNYLKTCVSQAGMSMKPVALTEYNIFAIGSKQMVSQIGGMFAVLVTGETIKTGFGAACRWDLANGYNNGDDHGMYSYDNEPGVTRFSPRPAFYYLYYMQKYMGNVMVKTTFKGSADIRAYSGRFSTGHISTVIANTGKYRRIIRVNVDSATVGTRYYTYTLTGGTDVPSDPLMPFSRKVIVNGEGPAGVAGGPLNYKTLQAKSGLVSNGILIDMPPFSVAYVLADTGRNQIVLNDTVYPAVTWNNPADIIYGNALTPTQLNASANMTGSFVYNPPSGTKLNAGKGIDIAVTFTPADVTYSPVTRTVKINVSKATPLIQWSAPASISYGTPLGDTQLDASAVVAGTFEYVPPAGTILEAGSGQVLQVTFIPADTGNYNRATKSVQITVNSVTGLAEHDAGQIGIYPVPVADRLNITGLTGFKNSSSVSLQVLSMDGSIVYRTTFRQVTGSKTFEIAGLANGVYMLQLQSDGNRVMKKFVVQK